MAFKSWLKYFLNNFCSCNLQINVIIFSDNFCSCYSSLQVFLCLFWMRSLEMNYFAITIFLIDSSESFLRTNMLIGPDWKAFEMWYLHTSDLVPWVWKRLVVPKICKQEHLPRSNIPRKQTNNYPFTPSFMDFIIMIYGPIWLCYSRMYEACIEILSHWLHLFYMWLRYGKMHEARIGIRLWLHYGKIYEACIRILSCRLHMFYKWLHYGRMYEAHIRILSYGLRMFYIWCWCWEESFN